MNEEFNSTTFHWSGFNCVVNVFCFVTMFRTFVYGLNIGTDEYTLKIATLTISSLIMTGLFLPILMEQLNIHAEQINLMKKKVKNYGF